MTFAFSFYKLFERDLHQWARGGHVGQHGSGESLRIEKPLPKSVNVSAVVVFADHSDRFYFKDRHNRYETGGIGCVRIYGDTSEGAYPIEMSGHLWEENPGFTLFGGMGFFDETSPPEWDSFGKIRFVLPLLEFRGTKRGRTIVLNVVSSEYPSRHHAVEKILRELQSLDTAMPHAPDSVMPSYTETLVPEREKWQVLVNEALAWLRENGARKVVLARKNILAARTLWDPVSLFHCLERMKENSFLFFCRQKNGDAFLGRSPERLFRLSSGILASDAIAGTRRRGDNPVQDDRLATELMASAKDLLEHRFVVDYIREQMAFFCKNVSVEVSRSPLKLRHLQHILTRISGSIKKDLGPVDILHRLHPTPAVGGMPPGLSRALIQRLEPFGRGWFGAPVGWMTKDAAEFAVGIRSALVHGDELHLFGGAGIVIGSDAGMEWKETGHKMENFTRILRGC